MEKSQTMSIQINQHICSAQKTRTGKDITDHDKKFINNLFLELAGIFPAWKNAFEGIDGIRSAKRNWATGLLDDGITSTEQINRGLKTARKSKSPFMPSIGMFISWCKPDISELGIASAEVAWGELLFASRMGSYGEPYRYKSGILLAVRNDHRCDVYNWKLLTGDNGLKRFTSLYDEYLERAKNGEVFELPVLLDSH